MDSRRLEHFLAAYRHRSLGRAAEALNISQPGLSKSIRNLEAELQVTLFDRTPVGLMPTAFGEALALHARTVQAELESAGREIAMLRGAAKGLVKVGATPGVTAGLMPAVATVLLRDRPSIQLQVTEGLVETQLPALRRGELDLVVGGWTRGTDPGLRTEMVFSDTVRVWARRGHPLSRGPVALERLLDYPWVTPPSVQFWLDALDRAFVARDLVPPSPAVITNSANLIVGMLEQSDTLTYLPEQVFGGRRGRAAVVALEVDGLEQTIDIRLTHRTAATLTPATLALIDVLRRTARSITSG